ncbi:MAG: hypothetical protein HQ503_07440 [Rhodospirillales bacterium]|nr:hypothetical protein [Rhodospirillales bacterium]
MSIAIAVALHITAAVVWVGGMFFAVLVLRPSAGALEPGDRLPLWERVFARFFPWVWASIGLLLASGYWIIFAGKGGFTGLPIYIHLMQGIGWLMVLIYLHLWFAPYARFKSALAQGNLPEAATNLNKIRWAVTANTAFGLINAIIGASGRYWG